MKKPEPPDYVGMLVTQFSMPPSEVEEFHPNAQPGEFYASWQARKGSEQWTIGPFKSRDEARTMICATAIETGVQDGILGSVEILEERPYQMEKLGWAISTALRKQISDEDAKICFEWALERRRPRE